MAGPRLQPLLLLLLSLALRSAGQEAQDTGERIINGNVCPRGSHPWQVALYYNNKFKCAGVLVNQQWVLTVAHCHQSEYIVQMGSDLLVDVRAQRIRATESFIHPRYNNRTNNHDIMLVKLHSPATLSPIVNTINLPSSCKGNATSCTVSGWDVTTMHGATKPSRLMCSNVNIISYQECKQSYRNLLKKYMLCAATPNGFSNSCKFLVTPFVDATRELAGAGAKPLTWPQE
ncbi:kallikrein-7-like [Myotis lucifugus]|uniref:kallikrein-7-like n=1 Tax=Myotis lucifugus TaxID=59463 RepID=UPI0006D737AB|nr:kallikrein-7-like [Myotis lucifugus]